ncbi:DNA-directed primase/polymerase protein [Hydra vulgaris]|uniref:DNA-directed primase/polymerase protein n=1 Tax=Hydra vulgaris TaxID=6087 RepID=UPI001F5ED2B0|nr:DNA-directed primase/polymerase protein [Hydra vulgaris]
MDIKVSFKVSSFYGATRKEYLYQLKKKHHLTECKKHSLRYSTIYQRNSYFDERIVWKWFPRQRDAFNYCSLTKEKYLCLFTYEKVDSKRKFLVTSHQQFWNRYSKMKSSEKHFYEVIAESKPCRLYFDIEFDKTKNPNLGNGIEVLETFIQLVCSCLHSRFKITLGRKNVVDLDSSTENKFSRHLIFHLGDNTLFINNIECGQFVKSICLCLSDYLNTGVSNSYFSNDKFERVTEAMPSIESLHKIMVNNDEGKTFLCDLSVYSKNRNFRLYLSSKFSKKIPLTIASENVFCFKNKLTKSERRFYKLQNKTFDKDYCQFCDTLVCPDIDGNIRMLTSVGDALPVTSSINPVCLVTCKERRCDGFKVSPYPDLDQFVLQQASINSLNGSIRRWIHYEERHMMIYDLDNNRWCANIGREHKSNHVYYVADLRSKVVYQKCHDPNCANFKSSEIQIPIEVLPFTDNDVIEQFEISTDEYLNMMFSEDFLPDTNVLEKINSDQHVQYENDTNVLEKRNLDKQVQYENDNDISINSKEFDALFEEDLPIDLLCSES